MEGVRSAQLMDPVWVEKKEKWTRVGAIAGLGRRFSKDFSHLP